jgi:hypothetical protein
MDGFDDVENYNDDGEKSDGTPILPSQSEWKTTKY